MLPGVWLVVGTDEQNREVDWLIVNTMEEAETACQILAFLSWSQYKKGVNMLKVLKQVYELIGHKFDDRIKPSKDGIPDFLVFISGTDWYLFEPIEHYRIAVPLDGSSNEDQNEQT